MFAFTFNIFSLKASTSRFKPSNATSLQESGLNVYYWIMHTKEKNYQPFLLRILKSTNSFL